MDGFLSTYDGRLATLADVRGKPPIEKAGKAPRLRGVVTPEAHKAQPLCAGCEKHSVLRVGGAEGGGDFDTSANATNLNP